VVIYGDPGEAFYQREGNYGQTFFLNLRGYLEGQIPRGSDET
jgi:hypothetical protein